MGKSKRFLTYSHARERFRCSEESWAAFLQFYLTSVRFISLFRFTCHAICMLKTVIVFQKRICWKFSVLLISSD